MRSFPQKGMERRKMGLLLLTVTGQHDILIEYESHFMQTDISSLFGDFHLAGNGTYHPLEKRVIIVVLIYI